jgi:hypothetical protein
MHTGSRQQGNAPAAETFSFLFRFLQSWLGWCRSKVVSKSVIAVAGIGFAACLGLSVAMQRLLAIQQQQCRSPLALEIEAQWEGRLVGPVRITQEPMPEGFRTLVRMQVLAGLQKERMAVATGGTVWRHALQQRDLPREVALAIADEDGGAPDVFMIPPPTQRHGSVQGPVPRRGAEKAR